MDFKWLIGDGLTVFNLVDGVVDEFKDESGVDTTESSNQTFDNQESFLPTYSNFYTNQQSGPVPSPTIQRTTFTSYKDTHNIELTIQTVNMY